MLYGFAKFHSNSPFTMPSTMCLRHLSNKIPMPMVTHSSLEVANQTIKQTSKLLATLPKIFRPSYGSGLYRHVSRWHRLRVHAIYQPAAFFLRNWVQRNLSNTIWPQAPPLLHCYCSLLSFSLSQWDEILEVLIGKPKICIKYRKHGSYSFSHNSIMRA